MQSCRRKTALSRWCACKLQMAEMGAMATAAAADGDPIDDGKLCVPAHSIRTLVGAPCPNRHPLQTVVLVLARLGPGLTTTAGRCGLSVIGYPCAFIEDQ